MFGFDGCWGLHIACRRDDLLVRVELLTGCWSVVFSQSLRMISGGPEPAELQRSGEAGRLMVPVNCFPSIWTERIVPLRGIAWNTRSSDLEVPFPFSAFSRLESWRTGEQCSLLERVGLLRAVRLFWQFVPSADLDERTTRERGYISNCCQCLGTVWRSGMKQPIQCTLSIPLPFAGWVVAFLAYSAANSAHSATVPTPTVTA